MQRTISGFRQDDEGHWVASIDCGHGQHMRHQPPMTSRPWVLTEGGRAEHVGMPIDCPLCERGEMPADHVEYKRTAVFDASSVPKGLLADHRTKLGTWGRIQVVAGTLDFVTLEPTRRVTTLRAGDAHVIVSALRHHVELGEGAQFFVAFYGPPPAAA